MGCPVQPWLAVGTGVQLLQARAFLRCAQVGKLTFPDAARAVSSYIPDSLSMKRPMQPWFASVATCSWFNVIEVSLRGSHRVRVMSGECAQRLRGAPKDLG
jgi:hypothetical protein